MLKLFNTLSNEKEEFKPLGGVVGIYTCGPSVYQFAHIGNFRTFIFEDVLVRYLRFKGYVVKRVMNLTDIEDKAILMAHKEGKPLNELTEHFSRIFFEDMEKLNLLPADVFPRPTGHIREIVGIIGKIIENGFAYRGKDGTVYFDVSKYDGWGDLFHRKLKPGKRNIKRDEWGEDSAILSDFALWKSYEKEDGEVFWETELGKGRPGWHIECSAMCTSYLGPRFDIHVGGVDNIYPHHEAVIAQNFAAFGENPSKYWLHARHLMVDGKKMSKSAGNFYTLRDLLEKGFEPMAIKYLLLSKNYRRRLNFTLDGILDTGRKLEKIRGAIERSKSANGSVNAEKLCIKAIYKFGKAMDDNLDTGKALKVMEEFSDAVGGIEADKVSGGKVAETFRTFDSVLGLGLFDST